VLAYLEDLKLAIDNYILDYFVILSDREESPQETLRAKALRVTKKGHSEPLLFCHSEGA
jgi:hypothetical protein